MSGKIIKLFGKFINRIICQFSFMETLRKFIIEKRSIGKFGSSSVLIYLSIIIGQKTISTNYCINDDNY